MSDDRTRAQVNFTSGRGGHAERRRAAVRNLKRNNYVVLPLLLRGRWVCCVVRPEYGCSCRDGFFPWWISSKLKDWPGVKWISNVLNRPGTLDPEFPKEDCPFVSEDDTGAQSDSMHVLGQSRFVYKLYARWVQQLRLICVPESMSQLPFKRTRMRCTKTVTSEDSKRR